MASSNRDRNPHFEYSPTSLLRDQATSRAAVQGLPPTKDSVAPSHTPSLVQLPTPDRRPYAFIPGPISEHQLEHKLPSAIKLSIDTSLAIFAKPAADEPKQKLELFLQKADRSFDYQDPQFSKVLTDNNCKNFFELHASYPVFLFLR